MRADRTYSTAVEFCHVRRTVTGAVLPGVIAAVCLLSGTDADEQVPQIDFGAFVA
ncbi:hypothetical protein [Saccharothrix sp. ALI-22-I]|uniref:hypothetical protein n=1 Tax=Saccharothrix sp. ALI-22-I TaxID=1933778 RepID=UPI0015C33267|nr:hypothetical protein [Saccharothrix sp. ALI-22-I]